MQRLLRLLVGIMAVGMIVAGSPCFAAKIDANAPASVAEVGKPASKAVPVDGRDYISTLEAKEQKPKDTQEPSNIAIAFGFIVKLALVLGLCYASILGLKKFSNMKPVVGSSHSRIKVIENSNLGANKTLHLVEIGSKRLLIASTPTQVNLLAELEASDIPETSHEQPIAGFKEQLSLFLGNKVDSTKSAVTVAEMLRDSSSFMQDKVREVGSFRRMFRNAENR